MTLDRRRFIQLSAASLLSTDALRQASAIEPAAIKNTENTLLVQASNYSWEWSSDTDIFHLRDKQDRIITEGSLQPAVLVKRTDDHQPWCSSGKFASKTLASNRLSVVYENANRGAKIKVTCRFEDDSLWFEPVAYEPAGAEDVVSLHYFAKANGEKPEPSLRYSFLVQPGLSMSSGLSPIVPAVSGLELTTWLGHGGGGLDGTVQQWGLPSHYFCGMVSDPAFTSKGSLKEHLSDAFCCGLAELPAGDLLLHLKMADSQVEPALRW